MKVSQIFLLLVPAIGIVFLSTQGGAQSNTSVSPSSVGSLGEVKSSVLKEAQFQKLNGTGWVLMDGRSIKGTDLAALGFGLETADGPAMPDARGVFLRGVNGERSGETGDVDIKRSVGTYQSDAVQEHQHQYADCSFGGHLNDRGKPNKSEDNDGAFETRTSQGVTGAKVSEETRPRNIAVYFYIKVND